MFLIMRRALVWVIISVAIVIVFLGYWVWRRLNDVATLEPGVVPLQLPSGATAYLHRQAYSGKPAEVYISANGDLCAHYDEVHDYKLPRAIHGGAESPLLISYQRNTIILHGPKQLQRPEHAPPNSFNVMYEELTPQAYSAYAGSNLQSAKLPEGWVRVEVPFGHNTCAL
ncbi:MAG TPA: hypothetical protein VGM11_08720 [Acidobacteriaceae bacterium]